MRSETITNELFGRTRGQVLALLFGNPDRRYYGRQIARHIETSLSAVQRELEIMSGLGLIDRSIEGHQVYFQANKSHPIYPELHSLIAKTAGIFQQLRAALKPLALDISFALVYGSVARGEEDATSDVDLMVVGKVTLDHVLVAVGVVEKAIGRSINPSVYSPREFRSKLAQGNHFLRSVVRGKNVFLIGSEDELRKVGRVRLAPGGTVKPG